VENQPKQEQKEQKPTDGAPNPDDYESYGEFLRDVARYEARQEADSREKQRVEKEKEISAKAEYQKTIESFNSQISEAKKEISDFEDVVSSIDDYEAVPALQEAILTSDIGAKLVYELAKNQKELDRINALNPALIFREIGKLEAKLLKGSESEKQINKKTNAPKPISPIGSSSSKALSKSIYDKDLTFAEYEALRRKQAMAK
jgi:signal recognition particle GTPase